MYNYIFWCELVIVLPKVPLKRRRAELHIDTKNKTKCAEMTDAKDDPHFSHIWLMVSLNWGQTSNSQNSARALDPQVGKYQSLPGPLSHHEHTLNI
jgi:hypothetical protein